MDTPPLIKGGQGRTDSDLSRDADAYLPWLVALVFGLITIIAYQELVS